MGFGQYNSLGEYCGPHIASSVFLMLFPGAILGFQGFAYNQMLKCCIVVNRHTMFSLIFMKVWGPTKRGGGEGGRVPRIRPLEWISSILKIWDKGFGINLCFLNFFSYVPCIKNTPSFLTVFSLSKPSTSVFPLYGRPTLNYISILKPHFHLVI